MLYLLDANVPIDANRDYYSIDRVPEFWNWLIHQGSQGNVKIPIEVYEEIRDGKDALAKWARDPETKTALVLNDEVNVAMVARVVSEGYALDLTDDEVDRLGRDPFLIAYAVSSNVEICVVTTEISKPKRHRANRHVPDVCKSFGIRSCNTFQFIRELNFSTGWKPV